MLFVSMDCTSTAPHKRHTPIDIELMVYHSHWPKKEMSNTPMPFWRVTKIEVSFVALFYSSCETTVVIVNTKLFISHIK